MIVDSSEHCIQEKYGRDLMCHAIKMRCRNEEMLISRGLNLTITQIRKVNGVKSKQKGNWLLIPTGILIVLGPRKAGSSAYRFEGSGI